MAMTKQSKSIGKKVMLLLCGSLVVWATCAQAALNLSVNPVSGGNSIRFGRVDLPSTVNQEVRLRITSDQSSAYQVFQRIVQPFQNERGETLDPDAIVVSVLPGSNSAGSLELQTVEQLTFAEQLIYTSTNNGLSDAFTLIYQVNAEQITRAGNFSGQILYSLRPIGGSGRADERVLNAYLEVNGQLEVREETGSVSRGVRLRSGSPLDAEDYYRISFTGNRGGEIRIYQEVERYPADELSREIEPDTMLLQMTGGENGELALSQAGPLVRRRQLIYSGTAGRDEIWIQYRLNDQTAHPQTAGSFRGRLAYVIESDVDTRRLPVDVTIEIDPVFELLTEYPPEGMNFKRLLPTGEPQYKEVLVTVNTNTGQPYLVSQNVRTALTNERGQQLEPDFFTYKQELLENDKGRVTDPAFTTVPEGESVMFYSDEFGSPSRFRVIYRLKPYQKMKAGDYRTSVRYTLEEK